MQLKGEKYLFYVTVGGPVGLDGELWWWEPEAAAGTASTVGNQQRKPASHLLPLGVARDSSPWNSAHDWGRYFISINLI